MIDLQFDIGLEQGDFVLEIADRSQVEVLGLFGPSGGGKTTILEAIAGLRRPARGQIVVGGTTLFESGSGVDVPPRFRRIGYVPQDVLLFPHMSVRGNLLYGSHQESTNDDRSKRQQPVDLSAVASMLEIESLLNRRIHGLSGGERQRVALGRALMTRPALLLMDEPLAAVDRARRERILPYLLRIRRELHVPLVYVTHDSGELTQIADRVLVIVEGKIMRAGPPAEVLQRM
jgi:molybdate transport system ATP-binding protein